MTHPFDGLRDRGKPPGSKRHLDTWVQQAQPKTGVAVGRLGWLVALDLETRATKDVDVLFRGNFADFMDVLDTTLHDPWGALELQRTEVETIENARRVIKPRRFKIKLTVNGQTWRSIDVEAAPDEGNAGANVHMFPSPPLGHFGLPSPIEFAGIVFDYQVAQKLHACTDPHQPPDAINDRSRDVVDLQLIRQAFYSNDTDLSELQAACIDLFEARIAEAEALGLEPRTWPPTLIPHEHWQADYQTAATALGLTHTLDEAVVDLNNWITEMGLPLRR